MFILILDLKIKSRGPHLFHHCLQQGIAAQCLQGNLRGDLARGYCPIVFPTVAAWNFATICIMTSFVAILDFKSLLVSLNISRDAAPCPVEVPADSANPKWPGGGGGPWAWSSPGIRSVSFKIAKKNFFNNGILTFRNKNVSRPFREN